MNAQAQAWADEMLHYVATVRPDLPVDERELQWQSLVRFRTFQYERIQGGFDDKEKRGILFEALVLSDPRYPKRTEVERLISQYLFYSLWNDPFEAIAPGGHSIPDDIVVEVEGEQAVIIGLVEVKLDLTHPKVLPQLNRHITNLRVVGAAIDQGLAFNEQPPSYGEVEWPSSIHSLVVPDEYDRVVFKPAASRFVRIDGWQVVPTLFSRKEVRVIADFLWHTRKEELPIN